jgi:8-oxo-dGTP diphosphatase
MANIETKSQVSAGGVVFRRRGRGIKVVLISVGEKERWQLPKGLVRKNESEENAAQREVREETGCETELIKLIDPVEYWYVGSTKQGRVRFHKIVHFYLLKYKAGDTNDHDDEVNEARWVSIGEAQTMLAFKSEKEVVAKAEGMIKTLSKTVQRKSPSKKPRKSS